MYHHRFSQARETWRACGGNLVNAFKQFQDEGRIEIATTAATHALLPLLANHPPSLRAQILTARDHYRNCFGRDPRGIWLPECAYVEGIEQFLQEADIRWFILDTHGILHARPRPRYGTFAPIFTPNGIAAFGRDFDSSRQVWSKHEGYPGDPRYRDFYRDIGFDLDFDYVKPHLPSPDNRGFTGHQILPHHRRRGGQADLSARRRVAGRRRARRTFSRRTRRAGPATRRRSWTARRSSSRRMTPNCSATGGMKGRNFWISSRANFFTTRKPSRSSRPANICAGIRPIKSPRPSASSWGEEGYLARVAERKERMDLSAPAGRAGAHDRAGAKISERPPACKARALRQAARELLLAQASDWPFILRAGTSPDYARRRVKDHLLRFIALHDQLTVDERGRKMAARNRIPRQSFSRRGLELLEVTR